MEGQMLNLPLLFFLNFFYQHGLFEQFMLDFQSEK